MHALVSCNIAAKLADALINGGGRNIVTSMKQVREGNTRVFPKKVKMTNAQELVQQISY